MPNTNRVILMGNLTRDPELRTVGQGTNVCNFGLAINRVYTDADGQKQQDATFVDCEAWGRTADLITQYVHKGEPLLIEGRLKLDQWQDSEGQNRSNLKVVAESSQFIAPRPQQDVAAAPAQQRPERQNRRPQAATASR